MKGWHFCRNDKRLGFGDGRYIKTGRKLKVEPPIELCHKGLHASKRVIDALNYSQGDIICKVELTGIILHDTDKSVATERTVLWMRNASDLLHEFACICAERALKKEKVIDDRCWDAIKPKRLWLKKNAAANSLSVAKDAAGDWAAWYAALAAAAARTAAWDIARDDARDAEEKWQNRTLTKMIEATDVARK